ncbi:restriction endonuclease subunit S [Chryseobacterium scophthalmum]|uniref:restriction endonuclease subunit S n=1 Tax=Chryseobacterium scophthalmum TaxID=59733 RepID=UPI000C9E1BCA|nr:restriction endonuclease subunit S [Chryseobacterium scophthalmum]
MTEENKSVKNFPNLRFPGFKGEWETVKLGDITSWCSGGTPSKENPSFWEGEIPWISASSMRGHVYSDSELKITEAGLLKGSRLAKKGSLLILVRGSMLFNKIPIGIVSKDVAFNQDVKSIVVNEKSSSEYILYWFLAFEPKILNIVSGTGIGAGKLDIQDLKSLECKIPNLKEQKKIGDFLNLISQRIISQKKIIEQLETLIKSSREKIFSQKLRFKDEQGYDFHDWEKFKLGEIGNFQTSSIDKLSRENENEVYLVNYMNVYRHEDINSTTIKSFQKVTAKEQQITSCNLKKGDILFTPSSETPDDIGHSVVISENLENAVFSYHLMRFRPKIEIDILYSHYFCNIPIVLSQLSKFATGSTRFTISVKSFSDVEVSFPSLPEQKVIGKFLSLIENKIEIEKQILKKLELQKKFLLANLFV